MISAMRWAIRFALFFVAVMAFTLGRPDTASAQVTVPVDLCGVGVGVLGNTSSDCGGPTATPTRSSAPTEESPVPGVPDCGSAGARGAGDPVTPAGFVPLGSDRVLRSFGTPTTVTEGVVVPIVDRPPVAPD